MKRVSTIVSTFGMLVLAAAAAAQNGHANVPQNPEDVALERYVAKRGAVAEKHVRNKEHAQAIAIYEDSISRLKARNLAPALQYYGKADAEEKAGMIPEALASYRNGLRWDVRQKRLDNPDLKHAILLAKSGNMQDAKAIYYAWLTLHGPYPKYLEIFPIIVVFDPDPTLDAWEYSTEKFVDVVGLFVLMDWAEMATYAKYVRGKYPAWILPKLFLVDHVDESDKEFRSEAWRNAQMDSIAAMTNSPREKQWIEEYRAGSIEDTDCKNLAGPELRQNSPMLKQWMAWIEQNHERLAGDRC